MLRPRSGRHVRKGVHQLLERSQVYLGLDMLLLTGAGIVLWISAFLALLIASVQRLPLARAAAVYTAAITATVLDLRTGHPASRLAPEGS